MYRKEKNHGFDPAALFEEYYSNNESMPAFAARLNLTPTVLSGIIGRERKRRGLVVPKKSSTEEFDWVSIGQVESKEQSPIVQEETVEFTHQELVVASTTNNKIVEPFNMSVEYYGSTIRVGGEKELTALLRCVKNA